MRHSTTTRMRAEVKGVRKCADKLAAAISWHSGRPLDEPFFARPRSLRVANVRHHKRINRTGRPTFSLSSRMSGQALESPERNFTSKDGFCDIGRPDTLRSSPEISRGVSGINVG